MTPIIIKSRYGDKRTIECVDPKGIFKIHGKADFCRQGEGMFDFEGGPMLMVGEEFYGLGDISIISPVKGPTADNDAAVLVTVKLNRKAKKALQQPATISEDLNDQK